MLKASDLMLIIISLNPGRSFSTNHSSSLLFHKIKIYIHKCMEAHEEFSTTRNIFAFKDRNDDHQAKENDTKCSPQMINKNSKY